MLSKTHFWDAMMRNEFLTENCTCGTERCLLNRRFQNPGIVIFLWINAYLTFFCPIFLLELKNSVVLSFNAQCWSSFKAAWSEEVWSLVSQCVPWCPRAFQSDWLSSGVSRCCVHTPMTLFKQVQCLLLLIRFIFAWSIFLSLLPIVQLRRMGFHVLSQFSSNYETYQR